jgi:DNA modification methylase
VKPYWADETVTLHLGDCLEVLAEMEAASIDAIVTDPPYGLEFMGREWDGANGFRRSLNPADAERDNVFGRSSRTSPEYTTGAGKRGKPGIGERPTDWVSNQGWNGFRCRNCGHLSHGGSPCQCEQPDFARADGRWNLFQEWCTAWAAECLRVLKPGGFMVAFGGTRTWHRLACGIEDAGFEIRDSTADLTGQDAPGLMWVQGSGFPKSANAGRAIDMHVCELPGRHCANLPAKPKPDDHVCPQSPQGDPWRGHGTAFKPAWEPIVVARKPLAGTLAANLLKYGTGALNIAACRVATSPDDDIYAKNPHTHGGFGHADAQIFGDGKGSDYTPQDGRWPPNVVLGSEAAAELDRQSGVTASRVGSPRCSANPGDGYGMVHTGAEYEDSGGASRFFPVFRYEAKAGSAERPRLADGTSWPTVKPVALPSWLVRLITPPGGTVLDLFAGTGSTAEACIIEGFPCVLIEKDPVAAELIRTRLRKPIQPVLFGESA